MYHSYKHSNQKKFIESFGILLFTTNGSNLEQNIKYLLVQRRDSYEYMDFVTGTYTNSNDIQKLFSMMSKEEKRILLNYDFEDIWEDLFLDKTSFYYRECRDKSRTKFLEIKDRIPEFIANCSNDFNEPSWGFPKGKKDSKEDPLQCALREFYEESGIDPKEINIKSNKYVTEHYIGNNGKKYSTHYYIGEIKNETDIVFKETEFIRKKTISEEIGNMGWFSIQEAKNKLTLLQRQKLLEKVHMNIVRLLSYS